MKKLTQEQLADLIADNISSIYPEFKGQEIDIKFKWDSNEGSVSVLVRLAED